jgi:mono/diheme cytochrome c family protein
MQKSLFQAAARVVWRLLPYLPLVVFFSIIVCVARHPTILCGPILLAAGLPSENAIPAAQDGEGPRPPRIVHVFRYEPTGTEAGAGVPYWIFRVLPRLFPEVFAGQPEGREWDVFGLVGDADPSITRGGGLPRGMVAVDTELQLPGVRIGLRLKRVAFNCAGCHQGEYLDGQGRRILVDGAPNQVADTQAYKRFIKLALGDPRFNADNVTRAIDDELARLGKPPLTTWERTVYGGVVMLMARSGKRPGETWMDRRPDNGPGRIDAFSAVKYETLDAPDDGKNATVDLPSLWNQGSSVRPWHHWDGNTADPRARNYGSVVGVGGSAWSVRGTNVDAVAAWLDRDLGPPAFPFERPVPAQAGAVALDARRARGRQVYDERCASCHGVYDPTSRQVDTTRAPKYMGIVDVGTDALRREAFDPATARVLNQWGYERGVWAHDAFRPAGAGYLAGPLDGVWARAPYLHNGSVPTLRQLVTRSSRPERFWRGSRQYDADALGWEWAAPTERGTGRALFLYDTTLPGNSNQGHEVWIDEPADVDALLDYLVTL